MIKLHNILNTRQDNENFSGIFASLADEEQRRIVSMQSPATSEIDSLGTSTFGFVMTMFDKFFKFFEKINPEPQDSFFSNHSKKLSNKSEILCNSKMKEAEEIQDPFVRMVSEQDAKMELVKELRVSKLRKNSNKVIENILKTETDLFDFSELPDPSIRRNVTIKQNNINRLFNALSKIKEIGIALSDANAANRDNILNAKYSDIQHGQQGVRNWENGVHADAAGNSIAYTDNIKNNIRASLQSFLERFLVTDSKDVNAPDIVKVGNFFDESDKKYKKEFEFVLKPIFELRAKVYRFEDNLKKIDAALEKFTQERANVPLVNPLGRNPSPIEVERHIKAVAVREQKVTEIDAKIVSLKNMKLDYIKKASQELTYQSDRVVKLGSGEDGNNNNAYMRNILSMNNKLADQRVNILNEQAKEYDSLADKAANVIREYNMLKARYIPNLPLSRDANGMLRASNACDLQGKDKEIYDKIRTIERGNGGNGNTNLLLQYQGQILNKENEIKVVNNNAAKESEIKRNVSFVRRTYENMKRLVTGLID